MTQYTIYCTPEQTKKALELGAPIITCENKRKGTIDFVIPTAEQMIGWLENQGIISDIDIFSYDKIWKFELWMSIDRPHYGIYNYKTRKEAELAAIDAALEYIQNKK